MEPSVNTILKIEISSRFWLNEKLKNEIRVSSGSCKLEDKSMSSVRGIQINLRQLVKLFESQQRRLSK